MPPRLRLTVLSIRAKIRNPRWVVTAFGLLLLQLIIERILDAINEAVDKWGIPLIPALLEVVLDVVTWSPPLTFVALFVAIVVAHSYWQADKQIRQLSSLPVASSERLLLVSPKNGDIVTSPFEIRGYANAIEGNIVIERLITPEKWEAIGLATAAMGLSGELFPFTNNNVNLSQGKHHLRICAEPFMSDERSYDSCVEIDITVT